jgi:hypothetical protein
MIDATYFRSRLAADVRAFEQGSIVEVHLLNGQFHRLRSVLEVQEGYAILDVYRARPEDAIARLDAQSEPFGVAPTGESERAIVAYESIAQVMVIPARTGAFSKIGFGGSARART